MSRHWFFLAAAVMAAFAFAAMFSLLGCVPPRAPAPKLAVAATSDVAVQFLGTVPVPGTLYVCGYSTPPALECVEYVYFETQLRTR